MQILNIQYGITVDTNEEAEHMKSDYPRQVQAEAPHGGKVRPYWLVLARVLALGTMGSAI